jgi:two-component system response regulator DevR
MRLPIRVLIADDSAIMRKAVREVLACEPEIEIVGEAFNVEQMIALRSELSPDIVIMDLRMAEESFPEEPNSSRSRLLAISAADAEEGQTKAKGMGASAFLDKMNLYTTLIPKIFELCEARG